MRNLKNVKEQLEVELMRFARAVASGSASGMGAASGGELRVAGREGATPAPGETR
jgi:hypothetical protein